MAVDDSHLTSAPPLFMGASFAPFGCED